jgi:hypothetical protein
MSAEVQPRLPVPPPLPVPDRRREPRQVVRLAVDLETADGLRFFGTTLDLGLGGLAVEVGAPLEPGEQVTVHLQLPGEEVALSSAATVTWARDLASGLVVAGLRLPPLPTAARQSLMSCLERGPSGPGPSPAAADRAG